MSASREFTDDYLARAGRPTVELIADAITSDSHESLEGLVEQLSYEVTAMVYGYATWPKRTGSFVSEARGESFWQDMDTAVQQQLTDALPVTGELLKDWKVRRSELLEAVLRRDNASILQLSRDWHDYALDAHDALMNYAALLISEVARHFGEESMQQVLTDIMNPEAMGILPEMPFRKRVETLVGFTRLHLLPFALVEDDEKATFIASPCPSGGRQVLAGLYEPDAAGEVIKGESSITYQQAELPAYCCHESALERASILRFGSPAFMVEPSARLGHQPCHVHVYKDPDSIPDRYFHRVGLNRDGSIIASAS